METPSFGAVESKKSDQDILSSQVKSVLGTVPFQSFSIAYDSHLNQKTVGVCTAIDLVEMAEKEFGIKFSVDFTYWGGKGYDGNVIEGSSNFSMLRHGYNVGFLPASMDPGCNNFDSGYADYLSRKKTYSAAQKAEAGKYKLSGYSRVADISPAGLASALQSSKYGLITMIQVGDNWYRPSWAKKDLELLKAPNVTGGHSVKIVAHEGLDENAIFTFHNSWGDKDNPTSGPGLPIWCDDGDIKFRYSTQKPYLREAYVVYFDPIVFSHLFSNPIRYGQNSPEVTALQRVLVRFDYLTMPKGVAYGYYGDLTAKAVLKFQLANKVAPVSELNILAGKSAGPATRLALNDMQGL